VEKPSPDESGVFSPPDQTPPTGVEPETIIVAVAWILAIAQICIGLARFGAFGVDRGAAIAFAIGCPLLFREQLLAFARRTVGSVRGPGRASKT
jgi:hypothetical protein